MTPLGRSRCLEEPPLQLRPLLGNDRKAGRVSRRIVGSHPMGAENPFKSPPDAFDRGARSQVARVRVQASEPGLPLVSRGTYSLSVLLHPGVDLVAPGQDAAGKVDDAGIANLLEKLRNALAARAGAAMDYDLAIPVDLGQAAGHFVLGDELAADVGDPVLIWLADVEDVGILAGVDAALEFLHGELGDSVVQILLLLGIEAKAAKRSVARSRAPRSCKAPARSF